MNYYNAVENIIKKNEVNKKARILEENYETVNSYLAYRKNHSRSPRW